MSTSKVDYSKPIPEPVLTTIKAECRKDCIGVEKTKLYLLAAQKGYNIAQVYVGDLEELVKTLEATIKLLREENEVLKLTA